MEALASITRIEQQRTKDYERLLAKKYLSQHEWLAQKSTLLETQIFFSPQKIHQLKSDRK
ncbi:hypothetical protein [Photorhabdus cinerea]|uniref:Uncharacterized protein n=1 Tax=Photorhabdus cinerea TaxID=471575 RepID=A0A7X5QAU8_9GAMM|nr:hypothetical protein [Photorhabdus cinerea]NHB90892.1 hypothetical protein [Photorhabdus cinerea]